MKQIDIKSVISCAEKYKTTTYLHAKNTQVKQIIEYYDCFFNSEIYKILNKYPNISVGFEDFVWIKYLAITKTLEAWEQNSKINFSQFAIIIFRSRSIDYARKFVKKGSIAINYSSPINENYQVKTINPYLNIDKKMLVESIFLNNQHLFSSIELSMLELKLKGYKNNEMAKILNLKIENIESIYTSLLKKAKSLSIH